MGTRLVTAALLRSARTGEGACATQTWGTKKQRPAGSRPLRHGRVARNPCVLRPTLRLFGFVGIGEERVLGFADFEVWGAIGPNGLFLLPFKTTLGLGLLLLLAGAFSRPLLGGGITFGSHVYFLPGRMDENVCAWTKLSSSKANEQQELEAKLTSGLRRHRRRHVRRGRHRHRDCRRVHRRRRRRIRRGRHRIRRVRRRHALRAGALH